jgi:hypothetical protein
MRVLGAIALALVVLASPCAAQDTLKQGDVISGKLRFFQHQHPNGTWINVYQLTADTPKKFAAEDEFCDSDKPPQTFHLVVLDDKALKKRLDTMLDKTIAVVADDFSCSETAWHVGDAVVFNWHFAEPGKR